MSYLNHLGTLTFPTRNGKTPHSIDSPWSYHHQHHFHVSVMITSSLKLCRPLWTSESPSKEPVLHEKFPHGLKFLENVGNEENLVIFWLPVQFLIFSEGWRLERQDLVRGHHGVVSDMGSVHYVELSLSLFLSRGRVWYWCSPLCSTVVFVFVFDWHGCGPLCSTLVNCVCAWYM